MREVTEAPQLTEDRMEDFVYVAELGVSRRARGKGVGKRLMTHLEPELVLESLSSLLRIWRFAYVDTLCGHLK